MAGQRRDPNMLIEPNISKTAGDRRSVPKEMAYGESTIERVSPIRDMLVSDLASLKRQRAQSAAGGDTLAQQAAVSRGELEQRPVEVHAAVPHPVRHVQFLEVRQTR